MIIGYDYSFDEKLPIYMDTTLITYILLFLALACFLYLFAYAIVIYIKQRQSDSRNSSRKNIGFVYIISNPSFRRNIYKIGMTERTVLERIKELFTTGVPTPFEIEHKIPHFDPDALETHLHNRFKKYRIHKRREFFKVSLRDIETELKLLKLL